MGKRKTGEVVKEIFGIMSKQTEPSTIQDITKKTEISYDSVKKYLQLFVDLEIAGVDRVENKDRYFMINRYDDKTLFGVPMKKEHKTKVRKIYATIKNTWPYNKPLTKTLMQKIAVDVIDKIDEKGEIPRGWYLYGEIIPLSPENNYDEKPYVVGKEYNAIEKTCSEYLRFNNMHEVRMHQYEKKNNELYQHKEKLIHHVCSNITKRDKLEDMRKCINDFAFSFKRREDNSTIIALVDQFCDDLLYLLRNYDDEQIRMAKITINDTYNHIWSLIATYEYYDSLKNYYDESVLDYYFEDRIKDNENIAREALDNLKVYLPKIKLKDTKESKQVKKVIGTMTLKKKKITEKELEKLDSDELSRKFGFD